MRLTTTIHGMARIGPHRELKWALDAYWAGRSSADELARVAAEVRRVNWEAVARAGIDLVPSNDFSLYDHVLDAAVLVGMIPGRFRPSGQAVDLETYFAMARGGMLRGRAVEPLGLTKWFDTNYHHLVPEVEEATVFSLSSVKPVDELGEASALGVATKPVLLGPLSLLLLSRSSEPGLDPLRLLDPLTEVYAALLEELGAHGATWVQLDEPVLVADRAEEELDGLSRAYARLAEGTSRPKLAVVTYFGQVGAAMDHLVDLPVDAVGLDFCAGPENLALLRAAGGLGQRSLFAGVVDGRGVWTSDLEASLSLLQELGALSAHVVASTSCSLLHVPVSLAPEISLDPELRSWLAFGEEKLVELSTLGRALTEGRSAVGDELAANQETLERRRLSSRTKDPSVRARVAQLDGTDPHREGTVSSRRRAQGLSLPDIPTTTIGSFPQTPELRAARAARRRGAITEADYHARLRAEIDRVVALQEEIGLDVVVHGEPERDDMVRYFAAQMSGFVLPEQGWVQSYGSRCARPPVLYGDVSRPAQMTLGWTTYAQSLTTKPVKGMLTGPITMLQWSFVRDDQTRSDTAAQLALALSDEVADLVGAGIRVVQVDEPALREGLPLRTGGREEYLRWATRSFRLAVAPAGQATQVHTHMCYVEVGDVLDALADMDVDVVSLEAARSHLAAIDQLAGSRYLGQLGPGLYDVHSPRVPDVEELVGLLERAVSAIGADRLWANPDCGLKTRRFEEVEPALRNLVAAAHELRRRPSQGPRKRAGLS